MDFTPNPEIVAFREEVRQVVAETVDAEVRANVARTGVNHDWALMKAVADRGWLAATVPVELGGQGRGPDHLAALYRELEQADAPYEGLSMAMMIAFILGHVGSEWQKAEIMSKLLAGGAIPCLGYSEPESGSDVAAAKTRAVRDGDDWIINGQKMFTSLADVSEWVFLLARTNTEVPKHRGLTFFLVPVDSPGIEVQEVRTLSGKRTNITFYDDVRVHDRMRVGDVDGGWGVMLVALAFERGVAGGVADVAALYDAAVSCARDTVSPDGERLIDDASARERLARVAIDTEVCELLGDRAAWVAVNGLPKTEGAEVKLFATEAYGRASSALVDMLGIDGLVGDHAGHSPGGIVEYSYRVAPIFTTAGGTSEIQKNLIAERGLGLPRAR
jgi:alkylation response protein AidB-like acyl-CoA dehydrogenase